MTTTTDPRTVRTGTVRISLTDQAKRDALIGRSVLVTGLFDYPQGVTGTIERIDGCYAIVRLPNGQWTRSGRGLKLI